MSARMLRNIGTLTVFELILALSAGFFTPSAHAAPLTAGQTLSAPGEADPTGGSITSNGGNPLVSPFSAGSGPFAISGTLISKVIQNDPSNTLGGLTFTFQLTNDAASQQALTTLATDDFTGFQTDVSFQTPTTNTTPTTVDRNSASVVNWKYNIIGNGQINPGTSSAMMVVQTDAHAFKSITANIQGGVGATAPSFGPAPEPSSLALLSVAGLLIGRRRK